MDDDLPYSEVVGGMLPPQKGNTMLVVKICYNPPGGGWDVTRVLRIRSDQTPRDVIKECAQYIKSHYGIQISPEKHVLQLNEPPGIIIESAICSNQRVLDFPCVATKVALKQEICFRLLQGTGTWATLPKYHTQTEKEDIKPTAPPPSIENEKELLQQLADVLSSEMDVFSKVTNKKLSAFDDRLTTLFIKTSKVHSRTKILTKHAGDADTFNRLKNEFETSLEAFDQLKESQAVREAGLCCQIAEHEKRETDYDLLKSNVDQHLSGLETHMNDYISLTVDKLSVLEGEIATQRIETETRLIQEEETAKQLQKNLTTVSTSPLRNPWNNSTVIESDSYGSPRLSPLGRVDKSFSNVPSPTGISKINTFGESPFSSQIESVGTRHYSIANSAMKSQTRRHTEDIEEQGSMFDGRPLSNTNTALRVLNENSPTRNRKPVRKREPPQRLINQSVSFEDDRSVLADTPQSLSVLEQDLLVERAWVSSMTKELYLDRRHGMPSKKSLGLYREYQSLNSSVGSPRRSHTGPCNHFKRAWNKPTCENCSHTSDKCKHSRGSPRRSIARSSRDSHFD